MGCYNYLDVIHIEKNYCESIIDTLLDIPRKIEDGLSVRLDLMALGIRKKLTTEVGARKIYLPLACDILTREEKKSLCGTFCKLKVSDGYSSNFRHFVLMQYLKITNLKSHDYLALMQQLLLICYTWSSTQSCKICYIKIFLMQYTTKLLTCLG